MEAKTSAWFWLCASVQFSMADICSLLLQGWLDLKNRWNRRCVCADRMAGFRPHRDFFAVRSDLKAKREDCGGTERSERDDGRHSCLLPLFGSTGDQHFTARNTKRPRLWTLFISLLNDLLKPQLLPYGGASCIEPCHPGRERQGQRQLRVREPEPCRCECRLQLR